MNKIHEIAVIGAGFGALSAVRELRRRDAQARITLIAPRTDLHYLPGSVWIPSGLRGQVPTATFKVELMCIIDSLRQGTLVWRTPTRNVILPSSRLFHWAKRWLEGAYLGKYR